MDYKSVPEDELESENYSSETVSALLSQSQREYRQSLRRSAAINVPLLLGSYLAVCACLAGYALSHSESIWVFSKIYVALIWFGCQLHSFFPSSGLGIDQPNRRSGKS